MNTQKNRMPITLRPRKMRQQRLLIGVDRLRRPFRLQGKSSDRSGFTLIEVLVVIGIIAVLAAVVLVAVNPARQFKLARDSQRVSNVNAILNAIHQNMAEHRGTFICAGNSYILPATSTVIKVGGADIARCVVPDYISSLPFDPSKPGASYVDPTNYDTEYEISQDPNGRITASSTGELTASISVTR